MSIEAKGGDNPYLLITIYQEDDNPQITMGRIRALELASILTNWAMSQPDPATLTPTQEA